LESESARVSRSQNVLAVLGAFFLTNALVAEMIGGKLIYVGPSTWHVGPFGPFAMSAGVVLWPVVFVATDLVNEYFGRRGVRRLTILAASMIAYAYLALMLTMQAPATPFSGVDTASFNKVFGQSRWIIVGSLAAFLVSQLVDVLVFHALRRRTGKRMMWLRSTGSTVVSQLVDSIVVLWIGLAIPLHWSPTQFANVAVPNYVVKLVIAVLMTPVIYFGHWLVERYLGHSVAEALAEEAARERIAEVRPLHVVAGRSTGH
jgi:queuosine precursor transporter